MSAWSSARCEYGVLTGRKECKAVEAMPQFTKRLRDKQPKERQPVFLCEKHRPLFPSVSPIDGRVIRRAVNGKVKRHK